MTEPSRSPLLRPFDKRRTAQAQDTARRQKVTLWLLALGSLLWLLLRSGTNPRRLTYPCQQAALANSLAALGLLGAGGSVVHLLRRLKALPVWVGAALILLPLAALLTASQFPAPRLLSSPAALPAWTSPSAISDVFAVSDVPAPVCSLNGGALPATPPCNAPTYALRDAGVDRLLAEMESHGLYFYKTGAQLDGIVGAADVVVVKINNQWGAQGDGDGRGRMSTNTDLVKGLIWRIVQHPDGFSGEVVIAENTQDVNPNWDSTPANAQDQNQSYQDVVDAFQGLGYPVSFANWDNLAGHLVSGGGVGAPGFPAGEYATGDSTDGYVLLEDGAVAGTDELSYPKFRTAGGRSVSMRYGVWNGSSYDSDRLTFINLPVLKRHGMAGATIAWKNLIGFVTIAENERRFGNWDTMHDFFWGYTNGAAQNYGLIGRELAQVRAPDLHLVDAIWVANEGNTGGNAVRQDVLLASTDPFAVDWYASEYVLRPVVTWDAQDVSAARAGIFRRATRTNQNAAAAVWPGGNYPYIDLLDSYDGDTPSEDERQQMNVFAVSVAQPVTTPTVTPTRSATPGEPATSTATPTSTPTMVSTATATATPTATATDDGSGITFYVRTDGGNESQCTGRTNAAYSGSGDGQPCAWDHPFRALPPGGSPRIAGGDTLRIGSGSYRMGYGAPGAESCDAGGSFDCLMPPIPSGPDVAHPTRILGDSQNPPELWGAERPWFVVNLTDASNVELGHLEITDHSGCVEFHSGGLACQRDADPYGDWASAGLYAEDSANVYLHHLNIHGFAATGIHAGRLQNWRVENVRIAGNGMVGWDGDIDGEDNNSGLLTFRQWTVEWNGCGESYPGGEPAGCWAQTAGGYGDGVGTGATGGDWIIQDSAFLHNTSDGLDLLYHSLGGSVVLDRVRAEGNAGNQIKVSGAMTMTNSVLVGNCAFFDGQPFTFNVDPCRALGNTLGVFYMGGESVALVNNTLYGQGDGLVMAGPREGGSCTGGEVLRGRNNLFLGDTDYFDSSDLAFLFYTENCPGLAFDSDYSLYHDVKLSAYTPGSHDITANPLLVGPLSGQNWGMELSASSPAIDAGTPVGAPAVDILGRPRGVYPDIGAYEWWVEAARLFLPEVTR